MSNQGEKIFSSRGRRVQKFTFEPLPKGEYELKLLGEHTSKACKTEPGSVPYVKCRFEALNTASERSGGKNKLLFHMLFTSLNPAANGFVMVEKGGQIIDLANAFGEELSVPELDMEANVKVGGTKDEPEYALKDISILDPDALVQWLRDHDGMTVRANVGLRKNVRGEDENIINFFIYSEDAASNSDGDTSNPFADEEEDEKPKLKAVKSAPKPATKGVSKRR